jgi:hypothetical protein
MTKAELESKHIAELHELAADAGVERYRMLSRAELIEKLAGGGSGGGERPKRERGGDSGRGGRQRDRKPREQRRPQGDREPRRRDTERQPAPKPEAASAPASAPPQSPSRPKRKRRRRRWGRRRKGLSLHDLLLPATGRQTIVYAETREACTALLRGVAAELSEASSGPDPIALLVDPTPEELANWKREAPHAEIVSAGKANHAADALAQARTRAEAGEETIVLIDSLTRFAETFGDADGARTLLDAGRLTVVAAFERN